DIYIVYLLSCSLGVNIDSFVLGTAEVIRYPVFELPFLKHINKKILLEKLQKFNPTVLHCLCETRARLTMQLARRLDLPYLLMINSLMQRLGHIPISLKRCKKIIVPAKTIAENIFQSDPRLSEKIQQINIGTFTPEKIKCFSQPSKITTILTAHQFQKVEEFENLFSAVRHLRIEDYEFMIVIINQGRSERQLWKLLNALDLLQIVTIIPKLTHRNITMGIGDIFIQPQPVNSFNPFLLQAMSTGSAIAACKGGVDDLIIENETAVVFNPDDELNVMQTLQNLLGRREFAQKIAKNAQQFIKKNHSVSNMISTYLELYNEM
ncbi:glycosyltransferase, partial [Planctomycetota bacterium]